MHVRMDGWMGWSTPSLFRTLSFWNSALLSGSITSPVSWCGSRPCGGYLDTYHHTGVSER